MPREPIARPARFTRCYGCGHDNERGLALDFFRDGDSVVADFTPAPDHGGYGKVLHGGVAARRAIEPRPSAGRSTVSSGSSA